MTFRQRLGFAAATLGLVAALGVTRLNAESRGTFYALQMSPQGNASLDDSGGGFGAKVAFPLSSIQETVKVAVGFDMGNLESTFSEGIMPHSVLSTTQDYFRLFSGIEIGRRLDARVRPHLGLNAVLLMQNRTTQSVDVFFGEPYGTRSDKSLRLTYDLSAGLGFGITPRTGLDAGVRYMNGFKVEVPVGDGLLQRTRQDYLQFYFGVTHRFVWPGG